MTLSDKRLCVNGRTKNFHYKEEDVKESIKELRKFFCDCHLTLGFKCVSCQDIDKIMGDKLR